MASQGRPARGRESGLSCSLQCAAHESDRGRLSHPQNWIREGQSWAGPTPSLCTLRSPEKHLAQSRSLFISLIHSTNISEHLLCARL